jgi:hypothetical protein
MNESELINGILAGGATVTTLGGIVIFLFKALRKETHDRLKALEKAVDACVFAKGILEDKFRADRKEQTEQFNKDREAMAQRFEALLMLTLEPRKKKRKRSPHTGG